MPVEMNARTAPIAGMVLSHAGEGWEPELAVFMRGLQAHARKAA